MRQSNPSTSGYYKKIKKEKNIHNVNLEHVQTVDCWYGAPATTPKVCWVYWWSAMCVDFCSFSIFFFILLTQHLFTELIFDYVSIIAKEKEITFLSISLTVFTFDMLHATWWHACWIKKQIENARSNHNLFNLFFQLKREV